MVLGESTRKYNRGAVLCRGVCIARVYCAPKGRGRGLGVPLRAPLKNITCLGTALQTHTSYSVLLFFLLRCSILSLSLSQQRLRARERAPKSLPHANNPCTIMNVLEKPCSAVKNYEHYHCAIAGAEPPAKLLPYLHNTPIKYYGYKSFAWVFASICLTI